MRHRTADDDARVWEGQMACVSALVARQLSRVPHATILEAGCGSSSYLTFPQHAHLVGLDISPLQLERNSRVHERIVGDLQTYPYVASSFDAIVCWDVLEHLDDPGAVLDGFARAAKPGGLVILGFPDRASLKGLLTRVLPFRTHVWVYRWLLGNRLAGSADHGPFPTPMRPDMARTAVVDRMLRHGFAVAMNEVFETPMWIGLRRRVGLVDARWQLFKRVWKVAMRDHLPVATTDCLLVFEKRR